LKTGALASFGIGYNFNERIGIEGVLNYTDTGLDSSNSDVNVYGVRMDALYHFRPGSNFVPYLAAGVGALILDSRDADQDGSFNYGVGVKYFITDTVALRGDVRHLLDWNLRDGGKIPEFYNNLIASAGLTFQFGGHQAPLPSRPEPMAKEDPPVGRSVIVAEPIRLARPIESQMPAAPAPVIVTDSDGDNVPDHLDQCPNTPWGPVDLRGCPNDSDGDGVPDYLDECPDTSPGGEVDVRGCPEDRSFRIGIEFMTASAEIDPVTMKR
jgi:OOP family OmpA-OmpF porin